MKAFSLLRWQAKRKKPVGQTEQAKLSSEVASANFAGSLRSLAIQTSSLSNCEVGVSTKSSFCLQATLLYRS